MLLAQFPRTAARELKILRSLRHENLVSMIEIVTETTSAPARCVAQEGVALRGLLVLIAPTASRTGRRGGGCGRARGDVHGV